MLTSFFFFFQAEDGIRDRDVTGVQTCALPICGRGAGALPEREGGLHVAADDAPAGSAPAKPPEIDAMAAGQAAGERRGCDPAGGGRLPGAVRAHGPAI